MNDEIRTPDDLKQEAVLIQDFLDLTMSEQVDEALERGNDLSVYISRTGKMLADAKYHRDELMKSEIIDVLRSTAKQSLSASTVNKLVDAACKDANYLVTWFDRLNRSATHQLEWCRTVVSKAKADQYATGGVSGSQPQY
jgi:hypothetical protein